MSLCPVCLLLLLFLLEILHSLVIWHYCRTIKQVSANRIRESADSQTLPCGLMERTWETTAGDAQWLFSTLQPENSLELAVCSATLPVIKGATAAPSAAVFLPKDMSLSHVWTGGKLFWSSLQPLSVLSHLKRTVWPHFHTDVSSPPS